MDNTQLLLSTLVEERLAFGHLLCLALEKPMYLMVSVQELTTGREETRGRYLGTLTDTNIKTSRAHWVAKVKGAEVQSSASSTEPGTLLMSPRAECNFSMGWMGSVLTNNGNFKLTIAASKWAQEHDRLLALILLYDAQHEMYLHHVGTRLGSSELFNQIVRSNYNGIVVPADDHKRIYVPTNTDKIIRGNGKFYRYYIEHQLFPAQEERPAEIPIMSQHWDFVIPSEGTGDDACVHFLNFVARGMVIDPEYWEDHGPHDPIGMVMVEAGSNQDTPKLGVMARPVWWEIENG